MTTRFYRTFSLALALGISPMAFAAAPDCTYRGEEIFQCDGDIIVPAGTLVTGDRTVTLITPQSVVFGNDQSPTQILCADGIDQTGVGDRTCGKITIWANTLKGALDARATAEGWQPGEISLSVATYAPDFKMKLTTEDDLLTIVRSGRERPADKNLRWAAL